jgi:hypothetical protein
MFWQYKSDPSGNLMANAISELTRLAGGTIPSPTPSPLPAPIDDNPSPKPRPPRPD